MRKTNLSYCFFSIQTFDLNLLERTHVVYRTLLCVFVCVFGYVCTKTQTYSTRTRNTITASRARCQRKKDPKIACGTCGTVYALRQKTNHRRVRPAKLHKLHSCAEASDTMLLSSHTHKHRNVHLYFRHGAI